MDEVEAWDQRAMALAERGESMTVAVACCPAHAAVGSVRCADFAPTGVDVLKANGLERLAWKFTVNVEPDFDEIPG